MEPQAPPKELPEKIAEIGAAAVDAVAEVTEKAMTASDAAHGNDLTGIALVVLAALLCGMLMTRLRQPAIVGYILAGVILGPSGLSVVKDRGSLELLAEMGVLLLLFLVGLELSLRSFRRMWRLAVFTVAFQITASVAVTLLCSQVFGWSTPLAVLLGFMVALSSTAVVVKMLEDLGELRTRTGRVTVGILIAQDLAVVPMLLWVDAMRGGDFEWTTIPKIVLSIGFLAWLIWYLSRGRKVVLPFTDRILPNVDLRPLAALAFCFGWASIAGVMGLSAAYGAFIAGLIVGNSTLRQAITDTVVPIQSILMMVFFLSIGLLLDMSFIWDNLGRVLLLFFLVSVFKTVINVGFLRALGQPWERAFLSGVMLAQIGEFSFLLSVVGVSAGVLNADDSRLVVSVTVMSLALSPLWVVTARRIQALAHEGVSSGSELVRLVYAPETEILSETIGTARSRTMRQLRKGALLLRRQRLRRARRKKADAVAVKPAAVPAAAETPSDDEKPTSSPKAAEKPAAKAKPAAKSKAKAKDR
ncbi:cation:proton antiporter [Thalassospiraceae bacterium LMO-SO8]|nr:cation:proton antiporter [Alphaproteobacteria bacterium LMO-S08]WND76995.1 cation:proton antiporter [Thalassospiraceae bacterium LMO-SO8]